MSHAVVAQRPWRHFAIVTIAYAAAMSSCVVASRFLPEGLALHWQMAAYTTLATVVVFVFSVLNDNTSVYDPYWSLAPVGFALWLALGPGQGRFDARTVLVTALCVAYGVRLTYNWAVGWSGLTHEDWRYVKFRQQMGKGYWPFSFAGLHFFPTVMTFLGALPLIAALTGQPSAPLNLFDALGLVITGSGIVIEAVADEQLRAFRRAKREDGAICNVGLWSWSRHPNYFGELSVWLGLMCFGFAAGAPTWSSVGFVAMVALFVGASIPLAEKRSLERRPHYKEHQQRVSMLIPLPPRR